MALNTPYKRVDLNVNPNYASMAQKDPWFALGYALGEGYWNNYNARGEKKSIETGKQLFADWLKNGGAPKEAPQDLVNQAMTLSIGGNTVKEDSIKKAGEGDDKNAIKPEIDHGLLKWNYVSDKYQDNPNPAGDSITAQKFANNIELGLKNMDMSAFDENQFYLALDEALLRDNRNARQRAAAREAIKPMVDAKKAEYNGKVVNQLYSLYIQANEAEDYANAEKFAVQIAQINPDLGQYLLRGGVSAKDVFNAREADKRAKYKGGGNKLNRSGNESYLVKNVSDAQYQMWHKVLADENASEESKATARKNINYYDTYGPSGVDINDAYDVTELLGNWIAQVEKTNMTLEELEDNIDDYELRRSVYWGYIDNRLKAFKKEFTKGSLTKSERDKRKQINESSLEKATKEGMKKVEEQKVTYTPQGRVEGSHVVTIENAFKDKKPDKEGNVGLVKYLKSKKENEK